MTDNDAFLRAILENPDDDAPRLMYADWLEERGDPRGELIRVQCALEQLTDEDEGWSSLKSREKELLAVHGEAWAGRVRELATGWTFRRGFVEEVQVDGRTFLARGNELFWAAPLRLVRLDVDNVPITELAQCPHLRQLRGLEAGPYRMRVADLNQLLSSPHLSDLRELRIDVNVESALEARLLCSVPLHRFSTLGLGLTLHGRRSIAPLEGLSLPAGLQLLSVQGFRLGDEGLHALTALPLAARLTALDLRNNNLTAAGVRSLAAASQMTQVLFLSLNSNSIERAGILSLAGAAHLASLKALRLKETDLGEEGAQLLATSPYLQRLTALDLGRDLLGRYGTELLAHSPNLASLRKLFLASNGLGDAGAEALAQSPYLSRLTELSLDSNRIGPRGVRALASSGTLQRLRRLGLANNPIGDAGAQALLHSPHLTRLQALAPGMGLSTTVAEQLRARFPQDVHPLPESGL